MPGRDRSDPDDPEFRRELAALAEVAVRRDRAWLVAAIAIGVTALVVTIVACVALGIPMPGSLFDGHRLERDGVGFVVFLALGVPLLALAHRVIARRRARWIDAAAARYDAPRDVVAADVARSEGEPAPGADR
jgi:hypothetical protein